jgi:hypothetical protein
MLCPFENFLLTPLEINEVSKVHAVVDIGIERELVIECRAFAVSHA